MLLWSFESREEREEYLPRFNWRDQIRYDQSDPGPRLPDNTFISIHAVGIAHQNHSLTEVMSS
jgi:hypothetical protein